MAIYLYGLVLPRNAHLIPAHISGLGGSAVRVLPCGQLDALVSALDRAPARASLEDIRTHDHVLQSVVHHGVTVAATRFGQSFASDEEARTHVADRGGRITRVLEDCDGCVEMRILMPNTVHEPPAATDTLPANTDEDIGPGRAYLERLRSASQKDRVAGLALRPALGPVVRAERVEKLSNARRIVFSHLVQRAEEPAYRDAVMALPALAEARVVGPLALYSFAEAE